MGSEDGSSELICCFLFFLSLASVSNFVLLLDCRFSSFCRLFRACPIINSSSKARATTKLTIDEVHAISESKYGHLSSFELRSRQKGA